MGTSSAWRSESPQRLGQEHPRHPKGLQQFQAGSEISAAGEKWKSIFMERMVDRTKSLSLQHVNRSKNTELNMTMFPFEAAFEAILENPESYVDAVFSCLESEFLIMPKGAGFIDYPVFEKGYEALKAVTKGLSTFDSAAVLSVALKEPISIVVLRAMLGFTPPEWGDVTTQQTGVAVNQGFVAPSIAKFGWLPKHRSAIVA